MLWFNRAQIAWIQFAELPFVRNHKRNQKNPAILINVAKIVDFDEP